MTIYYIKQDNTIWGCGDPACCGEYYEEIDEIFVKCEHEDVEDIELHLQGHEGGGPVLKWRKATREEASIFENGYVEGYSDISDDTWDWVNKNVRENIIRILNNKKYHHLVSESVIWHKGDPTKPPQMVHADNCVGCEIEKIIEEGIKGKTE